MGPPLTCPSVPFKGMSRSPSFSMRLMLGQGQRCDNCEKSVRQSRVNSDCVSIDFRVACRVDYFYRLSEELIAAYAAANKDVDCEGGSPMYVTAPWRVTTTARRQSVVREGRGPSLIHL